MQRDMSRAERFGERIEAANEARFRMEQKVADISDRMLPLIAKYAEHLFNGVTVITSQVDESFKMVIRLLDALLAGIQQLPGVAAMLEPIGINIAEIRRIAADMMEDNSDDDTVMDRFMQMGIPEGNNTLPMPGMPGPVVVGP